MVIHERIQKAYSNLSEKEKQISHFVLKQPKESSMLTITELASNTETSTSTITRYIQKIGYKNFMDFKLDLVNLIPLEETQKNTIKDKIYDFYTDVIRKTNSLANNDDIERVVDIINKGKQINIIGVGSSGLTAQEFSWRLVRMGLKATSWTDGHMMLMQSSLVNKDDVIIAISASGETEEVIQSLETARQTCNNIISLTSFENSSIAKLSNYNIISYSVLFSPSRHFLNSQFSILYLVDILTMMLLEDEERSNNMEKTLRIIRGNNK